MQGSTTQCGLSIGPWPGDRSTAQVSQNTDLSPGRPVVPHKLDNASQRAILIQHIANSNLWGGNGRGTVVNECHNQEMIPSTSACGLMQIVLFPIVRVPVSH